MDDVVMKKEERSVQLSKGAAAAVVKELLKTGVLEREEDMTPQMFEVFKVGFMVGVESGLVS